MDPAQLAKYLGEIHLNNGFIVEGEDPRLAAFDGQHDIPEGLSVKNDAVYTKYGRIIETNATFRRGTVLWMAVGNPIGDYIVAAKHPMYKSYTTVPLYRAALEWWGGYDALGHKKVENPVGPLQSREEIHAVLAPWYQRHRNEPVTGQIMTVNRMLRVSQPYGKVISMRLSSLAQPGEQATLRPGERGQV